MVYKNIKIYKRGYLDVGDGHSIYYELSGNKKGKPVLFVHGGPGGGFSRNDKRFFNPKIFNIIAFDQRGSGKSKPFASLYKNTTFKLVSDMRKLLKFLSIKKTYIFGGSWGSTLSLVYAIKYPETVLGMVIRGIFLGSDDENYYFNYLARDHYPEAWDEMIDIVPSRKRNNFMKYYYDKITSKDRKIRLKFTRAWAKYEFSVSKLRSEEVNLKKLFKQIKHEAFSLIELYYLTNQCFLAKGYILKNAHKIKCPVSIVHGRYDLVCKPLSAHELHKKIKNSKLYFTISGHSASDKENEEILIKEMNRIVR